MLTYSKRWPERAFDILNVLVLLALCVMTLYPFYNIVITSLNDPTDAARGGIAFWPRVFSMENYKVVFQDERMGHAFFITIARTLAGTATAVLFTAAFAYGVSKTELMGRRIFLMMAIVTMYFSGGIIPYYLVVAKYLHLKGSFLVYIIPNLFNVFNAIIMLTFFRDCPRKLRNRPKLTVPTICGFSGSWSCRSPNLCWRRLHFTMRCSTGTPGMMPCYSVMITC